jgi:hypothetical protein
MNLNNNDYNSMSHNWHQEKTASETMTPIEKHITWDKLQPRVLWEDIVQGKEYHLPPYFKGGVRRHMIIIDKRPLYASYKISPTATTTFYFYPNDDTHRRMIEFKNFSKTSVLK